MPRVIEDAGVQSSRADWRRDRPGAPPAANSPADIDARARGFRPRIGIDARDLLIAERTGVERVVFHFIEQIATIDSCDFVLFFDREPPQDLAVISRHQSIIEPSRFGPVRGLLDTWMLFQLPRLLRRHRIDAFISFNTKFPVGSGVPVFATVHGVEWYFYPSGYRIAEQIKQRVWFELACRFCTGIITFADSTRRDILRIRPSCKAAVRVVPEGCDAAFRRLTPDELAPEILTRHGLGPSYLLSVCSLVPRKNIDGLLRAFALLVKEQGIPHCLALAGKAGWKAGALRELATRLGIGERVRFLGYVTDAELVQLYNQATLFVYPSRYEGFGLPLLEAMRCGVPVVTANRSATAEVAGEAAVLIDPDSVTDLAQGMRRALTDRSLRERLVLAGYVHVASYSWADMTKRICEFVHSRLSVGIKDPAVSV